MTWRCIQDRYDMDRIIDIGETWRGGRKKVKYSREIVYVTTIRSDVNDLKRGGENENTNGGW